MTYPDHIIDAVAGATACTWMMPDQEHPNGRLCQRAGSCRDEAERVLDALVEVTGGPEHIARFTATDFTLQHPLTERLDGTLFDCPVHAVIANLMRPPAIGDFTVTLVGGELAWKAVAA